MFKATKSTLTVLAAAALLAVVGFQATSQDAPPEGDRGGRGERGERGERGGRGQFDPAAMIQRRLEGIKESLASSEEEWKVLSPKIENLLKTQSESFAGGGFGGFGGFGGRGGGGRGGADRNADDPNASPQTRARRELRRLLEDKATGTEEISRKLESYRKLRDESREAFARAQKDVRDLLTKRQEAQLVVQSLLD